MTEMGSKFDISLKKVFVKLCLLYWLDQVEN